MIVYPERQEDLDNGKMVRIMDVLVKVYQSSSDLPNNNEDQLSFEDWIDQKADSYRFINRTSYNLDGIIGYQGVGSGHGVSYLIFVQNGDKIYSLTTGDTSTPTSIEQDIIDSFKFTN